MISSLVAALIFRISGFRRVLFFVTSAILGDKQKEI